MQALLEVILEDLKSHPKLRLPVEPTTDTVCKYYQIITASVIMFDKILLCALHIPLVNRSKTFHIFKIHNLPLPVPILNKQLKPKLDHLYLAISTDKLYITFPTSDEIFSCRMRSGSICEINNAIYLTNTIKS